MDLKRSLVYFQNEQDIKVKFLTKILVLCAVDVRINELTMLKSIFPKKPQKRPPALVITDGGNVSKQAEDEMINHFCFRHEKKLNKESLRLVVLAESERRLLFDSETVLPINTPGVPAKAPLSSCGHFQFLRHRPDISSIGQMIFGSMSSTKNESFKIHSLSESKQLMVSRVISIPKAAKASSRYDNLKNRT